VMQRYWMASYINQNLKEKIAASLQWVTKQNTLLAIAR
jgi:hypothetical protein